MSDSLWKRKRDAWEKFVLAYEEAVKTWPPESEEHTPSENFRDFGLLRHGFDRIEKMKSIRVVKRATVFECTSGRTGSYQRIYIRVLTTGSAVYKRRRFNFE